MKEELKPGEQINIGFPASKNVSPKEENKQALVDALIRQTDEYAIEALRLRKQRESEKIKLIGGAEISIKEIKEFVVANAQPYQPLFRNDIPFFSEIYRLNGWVDRDPTEWIKPLPVPEWINELIYNRFPPHVLPALQVLNRYLPGLCVRGYKHFQFLNEDGQRQVMAFRDEAISVMQKFDTWHEFRLEFVKYGVPYTYQGSL